MKARLQREAGGLYDPIADHIVVVGLGDVGTRVVRALHDQGIDVVAIERNPEARGVAGRPGPQHPGDHRRRQPGRDARRRLGRHTCRALVVASTDDVTNLETALLGRAAQPDLRVVLRLFDGEFADRVRRAFNIHISRSVSYLAAPAFAAAMIGRAGARHHPGPPPRAAPRRGAGRRGLGGWSTGPSASLNRRHESRLLAVRTGGPGAVATVGWPTIAQHRPAASWSPPGPG